MHKRDINHIIHEKCADRKMCGLTGISCVYNNASMLLPAMKHTEYRGYDSSGIAFLVENGNRIECIKSVGKLESLTKKIETTLGTTFLASHCAIGHTRWATHGKPSENNAHPLKTDLLAVAHNGVIENYQDLKIKIENLGYKFSSETDTECILLMIDYLLKQGKTPENACEEALSLLQGSFAVLLLFKGSEELIIGACCGLPLLIGEIVKKEANYILISSEPRAIPPQANKVYRLMNGDMAVLSKGNLTLKNFHLKYESTLLKLKREISLTYNLDCSSLEKYEHYMLKEICEQPATLRNIGSRYTIENKNFFPEFLITASKLRIIGCGSSYYAGIISKNKIEEYANIRASIEIASEFVLSSALIEEGEVALCISQSGETADTLSAMRKLKQKGVLTVAITNESSSSMAVEADAVILMHIGREISVASTKTLTSQLLIMLILSKELAINKGLLPKDARKSLLIKINDLANSIEIVINKINSLLSNAVDLILASKLILISGRGDFLGVAMEGALKLKEITYLHAEAVAAGEMKHGTMALLDQNACVTVLIPEDENIHKILANAKEMQAREAHIIIITDVTNISIFDNIADEIILLPKISSEMSPILYAVAMQLLTYKVAKKIGNVDIDKPRNLAKSVTVE